jgi:hypothetical protein
MNIQLTQQEADALLALEKHCSENTKYIFPSMGGNLRIPLQSQDKREEFSLDIYRSNIVLQKNTFQNRARKSIILARIDLDAGIHRNPDGEEIPCPHIHIFREGWIDKWAIPLPNSFSNPSDIWKTLDDFMSFCNITTKPNITKELFT